MEVIKKVESRKDFKEWLMPKFNVMSINGNYNLNYHWNTMPDTAKLALIQEFLRVEYNCFLEIRFYGDEHKDFDCTKENIRFVFEIDYYKQDWSNLGDNSDALEWGFMSYNEALAKGIEESLKLIDKAQ